MKRFVIAIAFTLAFSGSTLAGDVPSGDNVPPPPAQSQTTSVPLPDDVPSGDYAREVVPDITLMVVQGIISLMSI